MVDLRLHPRVPYPRRTDLDAFSAAAAKPRCASVRFLLAVIMATMLSVGSSAAHPHVFVDVEVAYSIDDHTLTAIHVSWTYDAFTTLVYFGSLGLDQDEDGVPSADDLAALAAADTDWDDDYAGDVYLDYGAAPLGLSRPRDASAEMQDYRVTVRFTLDLIEPVDLSAASAVLRVYDPIFFYAYSIRGVGQPELLPDNCRATLFPFRPDANDADLLAELAALRNEEVVQRPDIGRRFADHVVLSCE